MRHLCHYLGRYDKYLIAPSGTSVQREGFNTIYWPRKFFGSAAAHNRLLMWPSFYRAFQAYEYILMYHLDSLVLSDELMRWCLTDVDYIGAPWIPCADTPWVKEARVGNGGFALMKIESVLQVLYKRYEDDPGRYWIDFVLRNGSRFKSLPRMLEALHRMFPWSTLVKRSLHQWRVNEDPSSYGNNNDYFWSFQATRYLPTFKVASVDAGLRFAFEAAPRLCFEMNRHQLPFGCHAWTKFDREFWKPYLLESA